MRGILNSAFLQEYGLTVEEKLMIGQCICAPLLRKILVDLHTNVDEESTRLDSRYGLCRSEHDTLNIM